MKKKIIIFFLFVSIIIFIYIYHITICFDKEKKIQACMVEINKLEKIYEKLIIEYEILKQEETSKLYIQSSNEYVPVDKNSVIIIDN